MFCSKCGTEIPAGSRFCTVCGAGVEPATGQTRPMPPSPSSSIPSSDAAAAEDRRMALIVAGVVVVVALLVTGLAVALMMVLSRNHFDVRLTYTLPAGVEDNAMSRMENIMAERLRALDIKDFNIDSSDGKIVVELPATKDIEHVQTILGAPGMLQFRQVLQILYPGDPEYDTTPVTDVGGADGAAYQALEYREVVLEKDDKEGTVLRLRLGPTRLTGDIISNAAAELDKSKGGWMINFTLTDAATSRFSGLTSELVGQTAPLNQLAIVLDYKIESYPSVNTPITEGKGQITGDFTRQRAEELAMVLKLGFLPVRFTGPPVIEEIK